MKALFFPPPLPTSKFSQRESLTSKHQATSDHIVQCLLALREAGHDVANTEGNHAGDHLRKESAGGAAKRDGVSHQVGDIQSQCLLAPGGLLFAAFEIRMVKPLDQDRNCGKDKDHPNKACDYGGIWLAVMLNHSIDVSFTTGQTK